MKFKLIKNVVDVGDLHKQFKAIKHLGKPDFKCPGAPSFYKHALLDKLHFKTLPIVEDTFKVKLYPTYTFLRIYNKRSILRSHTDRSACEYSVSLNLGYDGDYSWPLWIIDETGKKTTIIFEPGDLFMYRGVECEHGREPADDRVICQTQAFFHFVDQSGRYENCIYDIERMSV